MFAVIFILVPLYVMFFLLFLSRFFFFKQLVCNVPKFCLPLYLLRLLNFLAIWLNIFYLFGGWGPLSPKSGHYLLKVFFCSILSFFFFCNYNYTKFIPVDIIPHSQMLGQVLSFYNFIFFLHLRKMSIESSFGFKESMFCCVQPIQYLGFFNFTYFVFESQVNFHLVLSQSFYFLLNFSIQLLIVFFLVLENSSITSTLLVSVEAQIFSVPLTVFHRIPVNDEFKSQ